MADDQSLLLRIRGDSSGGKAAIAETRAAIAALRLTTSHDFAAIQNAGSKAFSSITDNVTSFARQLPGGSIFASISNGLFAVGARSEKTTPALNAFNKSLDELSKTTGKGRTELIQFLGEFVKLPNAMDRSIAGYIKFGQKFDEFSPKLEKAGEQLGAVAAESTAAGTAIGALATPIGIVIVAALAAVAAEALLVKGLFDLATRAADVRGKMFDLSQQTGVSVETLSALEIVAKTTGGSIESLAQSLVIFQSKLDEAQDVSSKAGQKFQELGISTRNTEEAFREALTVLAAMPEGFHQTNEAAELFGRRGGKQVLAILKELHGDLEGAIKRFRDMGILISGADAKAADEFNDQLAILNFQLRAVAATIARDVLPVALGALQNLSKAIEDNREVLNALGKVLGVVASFYGTKLKIAIGIVTFAWIEAKPVLDSIAATYERIAAAARYISGAAPPALPTPEVGTEVSVSLSDTPTSAQVAQRIRALQELVGAQAAAAADSKAIAEGAVKDAERSFQRGEITRQQHTQALLLGLQEQRDIELADIKRQRELKLAEFEVSKEGSSERLALINQLAGLDAKERAARNKFDEETKEANARAQEEERRAKAEHEQAKLEIFLEGSRNRQDALQDELARGAITAEQAAIQEEALENERINRKKANLQNQLALVGIDPANRQKILDQLAALEVEKTEIERQQAERRIAIAREEGQSKIDLLLADVDRVIELGEISDQRRIASIRALAAARVKTEEDAEKEILAIRLAAIDREVDAINARLTAAKAITDPLARAAQEKELNNRLEILKAERTAIQDEGNRDIEAGRQEDLENERRYAAELLTIRQRILDIQRETAQTAVDILVLRRAPRTEIIKAQADIEIATENARHERAVASLNAQKQENLESNRTFEEQAAHQVEINREIEAEQARHDAEMLRLKLEHDEAMRAAGPEGGFLSGLETGQLAEFENGIQSFADVAVVAFSAVGAAIGSLAQGFGQLIQNWVLLGNTGPGAMKKMVASVLAGVAAQSAVLAVFELAKGFAALFFNPAEAAAHFTAAALFGSIALLTGLAGRAIAGNSFQQQPAESGGATRSGSSASTSTEPRAVQEVNRTPGPSVITQVLEFKVKGDVVIDRFVQDYRLNGLTRVIITSDGQA